MFLAGWSDAAYAGRSTGREWRLGCVIGPTSPTSEDPRHIRHWASKFTRGMVKSSLGGEVCVPSEMAGHMLLLKGWCEPS